MEMHILIKHTKIKRQPWKIELIQVMRNLKNRLFQRRENWRKMVMWYHSEISLSQKAALIMIMRTFNLATRKIKRQNLFVIKKQPLLRKSTKNKEGRKRKVNKSKRSLNSLKKLYQKNWMMLWQLVLKAFWRKNQKKCVWIIRYLKRYIWSMEIYLPWKKITSKENQPLKSNRNPTISQIRLWNWRVQQKRSCRLKIELKKPFGEM